MGTNMGTFCKFVLFKIFLQWQPSIFITEVKVKIVILL
jgi:hypothetical protein